MSFFEKLRRAKALLRDHKRVSPRALSRELGLDSEEVEELIEELVEVQGVAGRDGRALVWTGTATTTEVEMNPDVSAANRVPRDYTPKHLADKILRSKSAVEGERKQVTVLFADVKGSMELAEQLDPEDWHGVLDSFFAVLNDSVHRYEGTVNQYTGDGIMALFGAPIAHEDHAQRACHAALDVVERLGELADTVRREHGQEFAIRVGLNSGEVVVGKIGDDLRMDYTAQGHTVGIAQRMEQRAAANTICVSEATAKAVDGYFDLEDLGEEAVKGASQPVRAFTLRGASTQRTRVEVGQALGLSLFVGRGAEMDGLLAALARARAGNGQVVGVVAEAGTGKSRLCFEFAAQCRAEGVRVIEGRCAPYGRNIPLLPILQIFRDYFGIAEKDSDRTAREKLAGRLLPLDDSFREVLPVLFEFFGVSDPDHPAPSLDPDIKQRQLFGVLRKLVQQGAEDTVALVEDLHWIDGASARWLEEWVEAVAGTRFMVLVNFRPEYDPAWLHRSYYQQIALAPLGGEAVREMLHAELGSDPSIDGLADTIHGRTSGNPFFTEEVVQSLMESGQLRGVSGDYRLDGPVDALDVPASVQAVLAARIDRLDDRTKQLLQTAAVVGREFSEAVLTRVLGEISRVDAGENDLAAALRALVQAEFVYETASYPESEYTFKHPLTQQVAYETLLRERRSRVHAAVAAASVEIYADKLDEKAALLAHHCENAGELWQAALWHRRAAVWAGITNASQGARHWDQVRTLVRAVPRTDASLQLGVAASMGILNLAWRLGTSIEEASAVFEEGRELAEENGDAGSLAAMHGNYACVLGLVGGESDGYWSYSREAVRLADETDDQGLQLAQRAFLGFACMISGRVREGMELCASAIEHFPAEPALGIEFTGYSPFVGILNTHAWMLVRAGRLQEAAVAYGRAEKLAREFGDNENRTWMQLSQLESAVCRGDAAAAREHSRVALDSGEKCSTPQSTWVGRLSVGIALRLEGRRDEAIAAAEFALDTTLEGANRQFEAWAGAELALALLGRGDLARAERQAQQAADTARAQHSRSDEVRANLALVQSLLAQRDGAALGRIEGALARCQELIDETGNGIFQPEVCECRSRAAALRGDATAAQREIERARALYSGMGATAQIERLDREA